MIERRVLPTLFEIRATKAADGSMKVGGYAARYNVLSSKLPSGNGGFFRERINRGAFDRILRNKPDTVCLFNHDVNYPLGRTTSGTLQLRADSKGLAFDCAMPNTSYAEDLYTSIQRGDMNGCSFAFNLDPGDQEWGEEETEEGRCVVRSIQDFNALHDVSIVTTPAYPGTTVDARNLVAPVKLRPKRRSRWAHLFELAPGNCLEDIAEAVREARQAARDNIATQDCRDLMNFILEL
jgi:uncharacterized protein